MGDRLATIVRGILKDKFIRAIGERKWTAQDEESINKLSDFFTEFDQRIAALERVGETKPDHAKEHCKIPGCIVCGGPATVVEKPDLEKEMLKINALIYDWYCAEPGGASLTAYAKIDKAIRALVEHNVKAGVWERTNE